jgi:O-antigen ligase
MLLQKANTTQWLRLILITLICISIASIYLYAKTYQLLFLLLPFVLPVFLISIYKPNWLGYALFGTLAFSKDLQFSNNSLTLDLPDEVFMLFITLYVILYYCYNNQNILKKAFLDNLFSLVILSCGYLLLSTIWSENPVVSLKFFAAKLWYILPFMFFPVIMQYYNNQWIHKVLAILVYTSVIAITIVLIIHATYWFSFEEVNKACSIFFTNHVNYGTYVAILIPISFFNAKYNTLIKKCNFINYGIVFVFIIALFTSYCRSAWIAAMVAAVAVFIYYYKLLFKLAVIGFCVVIGFISWLVTNNNYLRFKHPFKTTEYHTEWNQHWDATFKGTDVSNAERFYRWAAGANMAYNYLPLGSGSNTFYPIYKKYRVNAFKTWVSKNKDGSTVHNYYLLILIEQGIPGIILFMGILFIYLYQIQYFNISPLLKPWKWLSLSLFVIVIMQLTSSDVLESDKVGPFFYFSLSIWFLAKNNMLPNINLGKK